MRSRSAAYLLDQDVSRMSVYGMLEGVWQEEGMARLKIHILFSFGATQDVGESLIPALAKQCMKLFIDSPPPSF
jgi:hypothetical protein